MNVSNLVLPQGIYCIGRGREREIGRERDIYAYFGFLVTLYEPHPAKMQDRAAFTVEAALCEQFEAKRN